MDRQRIVPVGAWLYLGVAVGLNLVVAPRALAQPPVAPAAPLKTEVTPNVDIVFAGLTEAASGPGVLFTDPLPQGERAPADTLAFGAGCTRWLQLEFSNHFELGKMVLWTNFGSAVSGLQWEAGQLAPAHAARLARKTGATHVVLAHIGGDEKAATLTLQLATLPENMAIGEPVLLKGSFAEINTALPGAARALLGLLKVDTGGVPQSTGGDVPALLDCGRAPLDREVALPPVLRKALLGEAPKMALAGIMAIRNRDTTAAEGLSDYAATSDNLLVYVALAVTHPELLKKLPPRIQTAINHGTPNYILLFLKSHLALAKGDMDEAQSAAEQAVRSSKKNPNAWSALAEVVSSRAEMLRQGRTAAQISADEWKILEALYPQWEAAAGRVVELDPESPKGWLDLASAATFNSNMTRANAAFWKAQGLAPDDFHTYAWGLQMFQPKWGGKPADLRRLVGLAEDRPLVVHALADDLMEALAATDYRDNADIALAGGIFQRVLLDPKGWFSGQPHTRQTLAIAWSDAFTHGSKPGWQSLSGLLQETADDMLQSREEDEVSGSEAAARSLLHRFWELAAVRWTTYDPRNGLAWLDCAKAYMSNGSYKTEWAMSQAMPLAPTDPEVNKWDLILQSTKWNANNGDTWKSIERIAADPKLLNYLAADVAGAFPEGGEMTDAQLEIVSRVNIKLEELKKSTNPYDHRDLAKYFSHKDRTAEARAEYNSWIRLAPQAPEPEYRLGSLLQENNDTDGALKHFRRAVELDPTQAPALYGIGTALITTEDDKDASPEKLTEALGYFQRAAEKAPLWTASWYSQGEALQKLKRPTEALAAYKKAVSLGGEEFSNAGPMMEQIEALEEQLAGGKTD